MSHVAPGIRFSAASASVRKDGRIDTAISVSESTAAIGDRRSLVNAMLRSSRPIAVLLFAFPFAFACAAERGTIGALLAQSNEGRLLVRDVPSGLAADKEGLREGDEVLLIDGRDVRGMTAAQVHQALSGDVGESVKLTLVRGESVVRVTLRRTPAPRRPKKPSETANSGS